MLCSCLESKADGVRGNVAWPFGHELCEPRAIIGKERAGRFFVSGQVARYCQHEVIGAFLRRARFLNQCRRCVSLHLQVYEAPPTRRPAAPPASPTAAAAASPRAR